MADERLVRDNFASGTTGAAQATTSTTLDLGADPGWATLASDEHRMVVVDPNGEKQGPEWQKVTAYTATATTCTVTRSQRGTSDPGVDHPAGSVWLEAPGIEEFPVVAYKLADESVSSSTTLQDDDHLIFSIGANEVWAVQFLVYYSGDVGNDIKVTVTAPAGASGRWGSQYESRSQALGTGVTFSADGTGITNVMHLSALIANGGTAGDVKFQWAQGSSGVTATTVKQYSWLRAEMVASA